MTFEFDINADHDDRSKFANDVCYFIYQSYNGDVEAMMPILEEFYSHFEDHVRNFYEVVDDEIPLFTLYVLLKFKRENFGLTQEEYDSAIINAKLACTEFYSELIRKIEFTDCIEFERVEVEAKVRETYNLKDIAPDIEDEKFWYDNSEYIRANQVRKEVGLDAAIRLYPHLAEPLKNIKD